jgi:hypothetical protein
VLQKLLAVEVSRGLRQQFASLKSGSGQKNSDRPKIVGIHYNNGEKLK